MKSTITVLIILVALLPVSGYATTQCTGQAYDVIDGDTVWMRCDGERVKVRLAQIDAPEVAHPHWHQPGQPGGAASREALLHLIGGRPVTLHASGKGRYGRTIGELFQGGDNLNLDMVRMGEAWAYPRYVTNPAYFDAQKAAKAAHRGIWALPTDQRQQPWRWRHSH